MAQAGRIEIEGPSGARLAARVDVPVGRVRGTALFAHCFTCSKDVLAARRVSAELARLGILTVRFDFTGLGHSGGEFASTDFSSNVADVMAVADHVRRRYGSMDLLIGHSLGGAAALCAAARMDGLMGVVTIGAPADAAHIVRQFGADVERIERDGEAEVSLAGRSFRIRREFLDDVRGVNLEEHLAAIRAPLMVMHSPVDETVGIDNATTIFTAARHPKSFVSLDRADHLLTRERDARFVASVIAGWAGAHLDPEPEGDADREGVTVTETGVGPFQLAVAAGRHRLFADEPESVGGLDTGPSPYGYLATALAACTAMTLRMYSNHKKLDLGRIEVDVAHDRVHARDCAECTEGVREGGGKVDRFERTIRVEGADAALHGKLVEIADKCPVHRTLERGAAVATTVAPAAALEAAR